MKKIYSTGLLFVLGVLATTASAQDASRIQSKVLGEDGQLMLLQFNAAGKQALQGLNGEQVLRQQLALTNTDQLVPQKVETDELGFTHQKFAQYYQGIRVEHATYTVHAKAGTVESISGDFERISGLSTKPALNEKAALDRALAHVGAKTYMWQTTEADAASYRPGGELVIVRDSREREATGPLVLAWKFDIYAAAPVSRAYVYVDARTGEVLLQDNIIKHAAATGTFATAYSGTQTATTESLSSTSYRLRDYTRGQGIETYNCRKTSSYINVFDFTDGDNNWTAAEYNNANFDNAALDAHWGAQVVYDYWKNVRGRNSFDNAGAKIKNYVHYQSNLGNAFWDGTRMSYGDGDSSTKPLVSLDVCAHEIGHAVCQYTAALAYYGESGALNESLSDIWGAVIENYKMPNKQTWLIGEDLMKYTSYDAFRSMSDPASPRTFDPCPIYYKGRNYRSNDDVHINSSIGNYWFYILSVGKAGTTEVGTPYNVTGIGIGAAASIAYRMESVYMTASTTYMQARTYSIQAATDLYGAGSAQVQAVTKAWSAVGVMPTNNYCSIRYSSFNEYIDLVSLGTINRTSGDDNGYYNGTLLRTDLAPGSYQFIDFSAGFSSTVYSENWRIYIDYNANGSFADAGELIVSGTSTSANNLSAFFVVPSTATVGPTRMRVIMGRNAITSTCSNGLNYGEIEDYTVNITGPAARTALTGKVPAPAGRHALEIYPNPAADALHFLLPDNAEAASVDVIDVRGARISGLSFANGTLQIGSLAKGMYTLSVSDGKQVFHQRFVKE